MTLVILSFILLLVSLYYVIRTKKEIAILLLAFSVVAFVFVCALIPVRKEYHDIPSDRQIVKHQGKTWIQVERDEEIELRLLDDKGGDVSVKWYSLYSFFGVKFGPMYEKE